MTKRLNAELLNRYDLAGHRRHILEVSENLREGNTQVNITFHPGRLNLQRLRDEVEQSARPGTPLHEALEATRQVMKGETLREIIAGETGFQIGFFGEVTHHSQVNPDSVHIQWDDAGQQLLKCVKKSLKPSKTR